MAVVLEGGCRVSSMNEGAPETIGSLKIWRQIGRATGAKAISLRVLEFGPGVSPTIYNREADEVFYCLEFIDGGPVINENCTVRIDAEVLEIKTQTGLFLRPGQEMTVENTGTGVVIFVSAQCPEEEGDKEIEGGRRGRLRPQQDRSLGFRAVRLGDRATIPTGDRWYRVLVDGEVGSEQVTQFVGSIPPGRAPDHFHQYEEVLFILRGQGRMWAGQTSTSIGPGSCIYLPKGQVHCVENTGTDELRLLGVFYPAGSPSVRYET
jgi:mannose-6-phosphate isomerase-like protein (cupin superfamily)